jgi:outer membrane protein TolC
MKFNLKIITYFVLGVLIQLKLQAVDKGVNSIPDGTLVVCYFEETEFTEFVELESLLQYALRNNFEIQEAQERVKEQFGLEMEVRAGQLPTLSLQSRYTEQEKDLSVFSNRPGDWTVSLQIAQPLFAGGGLSGKRRAQERVVEAFRHASAIQIASMIQRVSKNFYVVLQAEDNIKVQQENVALLTEQLKTALSRFESGTISEFDTLQAKVSLANAKPTLILAQNALQIALAELRRSIGFDHKGAGLQEGVKFIHPQKLETENYDYVEVLDLALKQRPEISEMEMYVQSRKESLRVAKSGRWPTLSLTAGYDLKRSYDENDARFENPVDGWSVGLVSQWNIWDGQATRGRIQQAKARVRQSELQLKKVKQNIEVEVRLALSELESATELLDATQQTTELATEALRLAEERYAVGLATYLENLQARLALTEARNNKAQAKYRYLSALVDLEYAMAANPTKLYLKQ